MKRAPLLLTLALLALPLAASAEEAPRPYPSRAVMSGRLIFGGARVHGGDAPREDRDRVAGVIDSSLRQAHSRVRRCIADSGVRLGARHLGQQIQGTVSFNRSERPSNLRLATSALPAPVERCVMEAARSLYVRPAPRGSVELRFNYRVR